MNHKSSYKPIEKNRRAFYDYDIKRRLIAGIVLSGSEAKSIRANAFSLKGSFANILDGELWMNNMYVSKYAHSVFNDSYDPNQPRKLLVHENELKRIISDKQNGMHIVILSVGIMGQYLKAELGIGPSKKLHDKRQTIKARSQLREAQKAQARASQN